jgi:hypothetical protein
MVHKEGQRKEHQMPYKHTVTDSKGQMHTRTSADRQYPFAVVRHWEEYSWNVGWGKLDEKATADNLARDPEHLFLVDGEIHRRVPAGSSACWSGRRDLAEKEARKPYNGCFTTEIIPCTPVAIGRHKVEA